MISSDIMARKRRLEMEVAAGSVTIFNQVDVLHCLVARKYF